MACAPWSRAAPRSWWARIQELLVRRTFFERAFVAGHAADYVLIEIPGQGILFQSDLYIPLDPPLPPIDREPELYQEIISRGLSIQTMVGGHGGTSTFKFFEDLVLAGR